MIKKEDTHAQLAFDKIIKYLIVLLVIILVVTFLIKVDILKYFKFIPEFGVSEMEDPQTGINCNVVASLGVDEELYGNLLEGKYLYVHGRKTNLYYKNDGLILNLSNHPPFEDKVVTALDSNGINVSADFLDVSSPIYSQYRDKGLPDINDLKTINGGYNVQGNLFCSR